MPAYQGRQVDLYACSSRATNLSQACSKKNEPSLCWHIRVGRWIFMPASHAIGKIGTDANLEASSLSRKPEGSSPLVPGRTPADAVSAALILRSTCQPVSSLPIAKIGDDAVCAAFTLRWKVSGLSCVLGKIGADATLADSSLRLNWVESS